MSQNQKIRGRQFGGRMTYSGRKSPSAVKVVVPDRAEQGILVREIGPDSPDFLAAANIRRLWLEQRKAGVSAPATQDATPERVVEVSVKDRRRATVARLRRREREAVAARRQREAETSEKLKTKGIFQPPDKNKKASAAKERREGVKRPSSRRGRRIPGAAYRAMKEDGTLTHRRQGAAGKRGGKGKNKK